MKKLLVLFTGLAMFFTFSPVLSANEGTTLLTEDWTGTTREIVVTDLVIGESITRAAKPYSFSKPCNDWQGCPEQLTGTSNGNTYIVYRQYYNGSGNSLAAWYSGWLYV